MTIVGLVIFLSALLIGRSLHTENRAIQFLIVAEMALGLFFLVAGVQKWLTMPSRAALTEEEREREAIGISPTKPPVSVATALGIYFLILAVAGALIVGFASGDAGYAVQVFTYTLIVGALLYGLGRLLGHRPAADA
jgi:uncharacterized membrane protein YphA (DoxX/SURF4 family)